MSAAEVLKETQERYEKSIGHLEDLLKGIRTGRASSALVDNIKVDYYGTPTPINQLASVTIPEARQIVVKPFDLSVLKEVAKALGKSDLGASPTDDGKQVFINLPPLSGDQRKKLAGKCKEFCDDGRVALRNVRREMNKKADGGKKDGDLTDDEHKKLLDDVQKLLKEFEVKVDQLLEKKNKEILE